MKVSQAILGSLSAAHEDDVVIITLLGHGSPDGNLVLFDSDRRGTFQFVDVDGTAPRVP